jgi:3-hydroxyisobutyrate dehydrogenase-like beta-hydroxyacid dehydrogenase
MTGRTIGLLHPGEMGAAIGHCLVDQGHTVLWVPAARSPATAARANAAGLTGASSLADLAGRSEVILSVCPPQAAQALAEEVTKSGFTALFVDANAIAPRTARAVAATVTGPGATFVDGGIIGSPPRPGSGTGSGAGGGPRLYLAGQAAPEVAALFAGTPVGTELVEGGAGAASAVKMAYAAYTKGTAALLLAARALARAERVEGTLLAEWGQSQPELARRVEHAAASAASKGWRWDPEMTEIATAMADAGLPDGFHTAAAKVYRCSPRADPAALAESAPGDVVELVLEALTGEHVS